MLEPSAENPLNLEAYSYFVTQPAQFDLNAQKTVAGGCVINGIHFASVRIPNLSSSVVPFNGTMAASPHVNTGILSVGTNSSGSRGAQQSSVNGNSVLLRTNSNTGLNSNATSMFSNLHIRNNHHNSSHNNNNNIQTTNHTTNSHNHNANTNSTSSTSVTDTYLNHRDSILNSHFNTNAPRIHSRKRAFNECAMDCNDIEEEDVSSEDFGSMELNNNNFDTTQSLTGMHIGSSSGHNSSNNDVNRNPSSSNNNISFHTLDLNPQSIDHMNRANQLFYTPFNTAPNNNNLTTPGALNKNNSTTALDAMNLAISQQLQIRSTNNSPRNAAENKRMKKQ